MVTFETLACFRDLPRKNAKSCEMMMLQEEIPWPTPPLPLFYEIRKDGARSLEVEGYSFAASLSDLLSQ